MRRAGDVVGTPDWQLDKMYEDETAKEWERQNPSENYPRSIARDAWIKLHLIKIMDIDIALKGLVEAADILDGYPEADKILSLHDSLTDIGCEINEMAEKFRKIMKG